MARLLFFVLGFLFGILAVRGWPPARFVYEKLWAALAWLVAMTTP